MPEYFIEDATLIGIADAIRKKEGSTDVISVADMANRIEAIENRGLDTSDATATENDIAKDATAYVNGELITGNVQTYSSQAGFSNRIPYISDDDLYLGLTTSTPYLLRAGIHLSSPLSNFGDATAADVSVGKTFTSVEGLKIEGTKVEGLNESYTYICYADNNKTDNHIERPVKSNNIITVTFPQPVEDIYNITIFIYDTETDTADDWHLFSYIGSSGDIRYMSAYLIYEDTDYISDNYYGESELLSWSNNDTVLTLTFKTTDKISTKISDTTNNISFQCVVKYA